ncbi:MAG: DJ-1/PfpI family protein [Pyrobaculum sp.]
MPKALIYVIDTAKREEYSTLKNFLTKAGYLVKSAIGSKDVNLNYDIDLEAISKDEMSKLYEEFDLVALAGGYKIYYYVLKKKPPLKIWDFNIDVNKLNILLESFINNKKTVVAPLATPAYLAQIGYLKGREATVYPTTELIYILKENGVKFVNKDIVKSDMFITIKDVTKTAEKDFLATLRETT